MPCPHAQDSGQATCPSCDHGPFDAPVLAALPPHPALRRLLSGTLPAANEAGALGCGECGSKAGVCCPHCGLLCPACDTKLHSHSAPHLLSCCYQLVLSTYLAFISVHSSIYNLLLHLFVPPLPHCLRMLWASGTYWIYSARIVCLPQEPFRTMCGPPWTRMTR